VWAVDETQSSYDEVPYDSHSFPASHPDAIATVATLFGMAPAPVTNCRLLELGCASGFNIIPMAFALPDSQFVGVDLSPSQIAEGVEATRALGMTNVELRAMDIMDLGNDIGQFDYIVSHGVFSWVSTEVQERILEISSRHLKPQGVAYISYNCLPGWCLPGMIRDMMLYHIERFSDPAKRMQQARAFLDYLDTGNLVPKSSYARFLKEEAELVRHTPQAFLYHDHLEKLNQPLFFHEFARRAAAHGLQYIWESYQGDMSLYLKKEIKETLDRISTDVIRHEQNIDFLLNRRFRQSLLCHSDVVLDRSVPPERLAGFQFVGSAKPQAALVDLCAPGGATFRAPRGGSITVHDPVRKAALVCLHETNPRYLSFDELCDLVRARLKDANGPEPAAADSLRAVILDLLRQCLWFRLVAAHVHRVHTVTTVGDRPVGWPVARYQAKSSDHVTDPWHRTVLLTPIERQLLPLLDGQHDRSQLVEIMMAKADEQRVDVAPAGDHARDSDPIRSDIPRKLDAALATIASRGLLVR
jgi:methyltransferase-like protein/SAM-dependent methyltransferase